MARTVNYLTAAELLAKIPQADREVACDDDGDGTEDSAVLTAVIEQACDEVDTFYTIRGVAVPLDVGLHPLAKQAAIYIAVETLYTRRGEPAERNPHHTLTAQMRTLLGKVAEGKITIPRPGSPAASASPAAVDGDTVDAESEPARTRFKQPGRMAI
jgi:phage gp36-like protein